MTALTVERLRDLLGIAFTDEQLAAITAPREPGVVVAGAGSGKTSVMAARVLWLVANADVAPHEVLGLTFTNKAAAELSSRIRSALRAWVGSSGAAQPPYLDQDVPLSGLEPTILTYHAYAGRLLAEHGLRLGLEPGARLLADATRFQLAERVLREAEGPFPGLDRTPASLLTDVLELEGELNEHLVDVAAVLQFDAEVVAAVDGAPKPTTDLRRARDVARGRDDLLVLVEAYREAKRARLLVDFGDQMAGSARLVEQVPEVRVRERALFPVVLLDEYQDTSIAQKRLLLALFGQGHAVTAVGDPFQAIYGWRGASVANIDHFAEEFTVAGRSAQRFGLGQNNRSGGRLLQVANTVTGPLQSAHPGVLPLHPRPAVATEGHTSVGLFATQQDELQYIAADVAHRCTLGTAPADIAILVRVTSDIAGLHAALTTQGVPVEVVGLSGLLELPEVADVVAALRVLDDPTANPSLVRLLAGPRWRIGPRDLMLLGRRAQALVGDAGRRRPGATHGLDPDPDPDKVLLEAVAGLDPSEVASLAEALADPGAYAYDPDARTRFAQLAAEIDQLRRLVGSPVDDLVHRVAQTIGLYVEVAAVPGGDRGLSTAALRQLMDVAAAFVDIDGDPSLTAFLAFLRAAEQHDRGIDAATPTIADSVKLLTIHKAKGLEWPVVYLPDFTRKVFPSERGRSTWAGRAAVLPFSLRGDAADFPGMPEWTNAGLRAYLASCRQREQLEERRLAYVALTRARNEMVLTSHWWGPTQKQRRGPSEYLEAIRDHLVAHPSHGHVVTWADEPTSDASNPLLAQADTYRWPVELDIDRVAAREVAARQVRAARRSARTARSLPELADSDRAVADAWNADAELLLAELHRSATPRHDVEVPTALTASQLVRLHADPQGFARDLVRPMPKARSSAAGRGTTFHEWVEARVSRPALIDLDDLPSVDPEQLDDDLVPLQQAFLVGPFAELSPLAVEAPFEVLLGGHSIRGRIDAVYAAADLAELAALPPGLREVVVDWKTGRARADPWQLAIYRVAWAQLRGLSLAEVGALFYSVPTGVVRVFSDLPAEDVLATTAGP